MRSCNFVVERDPETGLLVGYVPGWPGEPRPESEFIDVRTIRAA